MKFVIITGLSGAGKSEALKILEDFGFYCISNLPSVLLKDFVELSIDKKQNVESVGLIVNTKGERHIEEFMSNLKDLDESDINYELLFLEASTETLIKRYKQLRRPHPGNPKGSIVEGIEKEKKELNKIKEKANHIVDTSGLTIGKLKEEISKLYIGEGKKLGLSTSIVSFGFKKGMPLDVDLVFDVRFLPNPYYIDELRHLTGNDKRIRDYVMSFEESKIFFDKLKDMIAFLIPQYVKEGKSQLIIGIGCTGGKHRSVTIANELYGYLSSKDFVVTKSHKEID